MCIQKGYRKYKLRLNRYDFYVNGFKCDILIITKSCVILKILANLKKLFYVRIIFFETQKYKARINSNGKLACYREIFKFVCTYRPSF
jgi:hypothetical protein